MPHARVTNKSVRANGLAANLRLLTNYNTINPENTFSPTYKRNSNSPSKSSGNSTQPFSSICVEKTTISSEMSSTLTPTKSVSKKILVPICVAYKGLEGVRSNGVFSYRGDNRLMGHVLEFHLKGLPQASHLLQKADKTIMIRVFVS